MNLKQFYIGRLIGFVVVLALATLVAIVVHIHNGKVYDTEGDVVSSSGNLQCVESAGYMVISKPLPDAPGTDILVKYKARPDQKTSCDYGVDGGDLEIKNENAEYFLALAGHYLVLDSGTAPDPRTLIVYDLDARKQIYTGLYSKPLTVKGETLTYWEPTDDGATAANCPSASEYASQGLGAEIEKEVTLDLSTATQTQTGAVRCSPKQ